MDDGHEAALATLALQVGERLKINGWTLSTAESCTGGLIAHQLTEIAGSSAYFIGSVVAYANAIKQNVLHVREATLMQYGAVSEPVAYQMAVNARALFDADFALSVTGIAGPGGGTPEKPVGLTYIGCARRDGQVIVERQVWTFDRSGNKAASAAAALRLLLRQLALG